MSNPDNEIYFLSKFENLIADLQSRYLVLNFFPHLYNSQWHVSINDGALQIWLYSYSLRRDCIDECRILNRRYNV